MRSELEKIEWVERYLLGEMTGDEKQKFENDLKSDSSLIEQLDFQSKLIEGAKRLQLKEQIQTAGKRYHTLKMLSGLAIAIVIISTLSAIAYYYYPSWSEQPKPSGSTIQMMEDTTSLALIEPTLTPELEVQRFHILLAKDTVIETEAGIVLAIPDNAFDTQSSHVDIEIREALDPYDIMRFGLSTMSDDKMLETAGMFEIHARANGQEVQFLKELMVEVPGHQEQKEMKLFDGVENESGKINWLNPKPVEVFLKNVPVESLDFYPPNYIDELKKLKLDTENKYFTDSLYYSLELGSYVSESSIVGMRETEEFLPSNDTVVSYATQASNINSGIVSTVSGLNPSQIRAIWNSNFEGSLAGTREFQERVKLMHQSCEGSQIMKMYLEKMDQPIWKLDSIAAVMSEMTSKSFRELAKRKEGRVRPNDGLFQKLKSYYKEKQIRLAEEVLSARRKYVEAEFARRGEFDAKARKQSENRQVVEGNLFAIELAKNMDTVYKQLGYVKGEAPIYYNTRISSPGWKNVDQYVYESTKNRNSMTYTDARTGKTAELEYKAFGVSIKNRENYNLVYCYFIPDGLDSYIRINEKRSMFQYNLNMLMKYKLVILADHEGVTYYYERDMITPGEFVVELNEMSPSELRSKLNSYQNELEQKALVEELEFILLESKENSERRKYDIAESVRNRIMSAIYPECSRGFIGGAPEKGK